MVSSSCSAWNHRSLFSTFKVDVIPFLHSLYQVYYSSEDDSTSQNVASTQYQIIHLNPSTRYNIAVSAVTQGLSGKDLEGPRSNTVSTKTSFSGMQ